MPLLFPGFQMWPSEFDINLLESVASAQPPVNAAWREQYEKQLEAEKTMRSLALAYSE